MKTIQASSPAIGKNPTGKSVRAMMEALIADDELPAALADLARGRLKKKIPHELGEG